MSKVTLEQVKTDASIFYSRRIQELLAMLNDPDVMVEVNTIIADAIKPYVPKDTGALQQSVVITPTEIIWGTGLKYAHYQYEGKVYKPNYPITKKGVIVGWYSKPPKTASSQLLGTPGYWNGWWFGYHNGASVREWTKMYEWKLKSETNVKITRYLKAECRKRGLTV